MLRYYLGIPVEVLGDGHNDGWIEARWPDLRIFFHWEPQLKTTPWGSA
jgi:hypothetical protein